MSAPINPTASAVTFQFGAYYQTSGHDRYDLYGRMDIIGSRGYALLCNGLDPNTKLDPDVGITDLLMRAPRDELMPMITFAPSSTGKLFGTNYKWRYRYSNSKTGETSGMSPIPSVGLTLGQVTSGTSWLGQTAYFKIPGTDAAGVDTVELLRNVSSNSVWFVIDKGSNPGAAGYVSFTDNAPDEDIQNFEQGQLRVNPTYFEPHIPPCARMYQHPTGRVLYYGHINMGTYVSGLASIPVTDNVVTGTNTKWYRGREGQGFVYTTDANRGSYRIIEVTDLNSMYVTPKSEQSNSGEYQIIDDIDSRDMYMSQPLSPCQYDTRDVMRVGQDRSDGVKGVEGLGGTTYVLTRYNLWALGDDVSENPRDTYRVEKVASVGCAGFWAWCKTPFGLVFLDETQGVMLFDGSSPPRPLGSESPLVGFKPLAELLGMDRGMMSDAYMVWDPIARRVVLSYCPTGVMAQVRQLSFDPTAKQGGNWRGPWRRTITCAGTLRNATGKDVFLYGDQVGNLLLEGDIAQDTLNTVVTRTILTVDSPVQITASTSGFTNAMVGAPIVFDDGAGNYYVNWIARVVSGVKAVLLLVPSTTLVTGWTFKVGAIHWKARTAYLDLGEPMQPKALGHFGLRYEPMTTNVDDVVIDVTCEGVAVTESADAVADRETMGLVKGDANVHAGGTVFQVRLSGRASYGGPQITGILAKMDVRAGKREGTSGETKKRIVRPTASA